MKGFLSSVQVFFCLECFPFRSAFLWSEKIFKTHREKGTCWFLVRELKWSTGSQEITRTDHIHNQLYLWHHGGCGKHTHTDANTHTSCGVTRLIEMSVFQETCQTLSEMQPSAKNKCVSSLRCPPCKLLRITDIPASQPSRSKDSSLEFHRTDSSSL